jgi:hypothetical protein
MTTTIFSWGYEGWGNATKELMEAVDAAEHARGFEPPVFVDVRLRREVRAIGFRGTAFEQTVGKHRYVWMKGLGNLRIAQHRGGVEIAEPSAAEDLLRLALELHRNGQRLLFFCSCGQLRAAECHRRTVGDLLLRAAKKVSKKVEIVEWPGGENTAIELEVAPDILKRVGKGNLKNIPLNDQIDLAAVAALPWASTARLRAGDDEQSVLVGPARSISAKEGTRCWALPLLHGDLAPSPILLAQQLRREYGMEPRTSWSSNL